MSEPLSMAGLDNATVTLTEISSRPAVEPETAFRVALLGCWSGRRQREDKTPILYSPILVDRDNLDEVMTKLSVQTRLDVEDSDSLVTMRFESLEDFHPDHIFERVAVFEKLRQLRRRLENPATFADAEEEMRRRFGFDAPRADEPEGKPVAPLDDRSEAPDGDSSAEGSLLDQVLEVSDRADRGQSQLTPRDDELSALLREAVSPYLVSLDVVRQAELIAAVDAASSALMRSILHQPALKSLEAAWRAIHFLVSRLETGTELKLYLLDVTKEELAADLSFSEDLRASGVYKLFVEESADLPGSEPWSLAVCDYTFDNSRADVLTLIRVAKVASHAGTPFVAAAHARVVGCESLAKTPDPDDWQRSENSEGVAAWDVLRMLPEASYLGLALPRFLLRLPYGAGTEAVESFDFEEILESPAHEDYLWGNPAFICAYLLALNFSRHGWEIMRGLSLDVEGLPLHVYDEHGEANIKPCAEALLTMRAAEAILDRGIMPLLSLKGRDVVRLARFQSVSSPTTPLAGRWR
jgi:type VI secretion system protein ImpC